MHWAAAGHVTPESTNNQSGIATLGKIGVDCGTSIRFDTSVVNGNEYYFVHV
jgi:hypothetical protein